MITIKKTILGKEISIDVSTEPENIFLDGSIPESFDFIRKNFEEIIKTKEHKLFEKDGTYVCVGEQDRTAYFDIIYKSQVYSFTFFIENTGKIYIDFIGMVEDTVDTKLYELINFITKNSLTDKNYLEYCISVFREALAPTPDIPMPELKIPKGEK